MSASSEGGAERRVAIVTGAAGGLGSAVVRALVARGQTVVALDLEAERVVAAVGTDLPGVEPRAADLADWDACERVVAETVARHGRVDVLVNSAAILRRTELDDVTPEIFARIFDVNCRSAFVLSRAALRDMETRGWGRIVNVTSIGVHTGGYSLTSAIYEATKAAVGNFTRTLARYGAPRGILVNSVAPGGMRTPMLTDETPADVLAAVERDIPIGRLAEPGEVAGLVAYLASEECTYASGATFDVNGGVVTP
jgi:NAD(P)-dependent dehydrogenase (short-subunit alcohol dehydrogenase family)